MKPTALLLTLACLDLWLGIGPGLGFVDIKPDETVTLLEGDNLTFSCSPLYYIALPIVERNRVVFYDSRLIHTDHGLNTADSYRHYTLVNVSREDSGSVWRCIIGGYTTSTLTVIVHVPPEHPRDVTVSAVSSTWAVVQWNPPQDNGSLPLTKYLVTVSSPQHSMEEYTTTLRANITGLLPGLVYSAVVTAYSDNYSSRPSSAVSISTPVTGPLVSGLETLVRGPGSIVVSWHLVYTGGTALKHYELDYRLHPNELPTTPWFVTNTTETQALLTGLAASSLYEFRVRGLSAWGYGDYTTSDVVLSHSLGAPQPPSAPVVTCWNSDIVCLHSDGFSALVSNITVLVYRYSTILYTQALRPPLILRNLDYSPGYQFSLILSNEWGDSLESPVSLAAEEYVTEKNSNFRDVGPLIGSCVGLVNVCLLLGTLTLCVYMANHKVKHKNSAVITGEPPASRNIYLSNHTQSEFGRVNLPIN